MTIFRRLTNLFSQFESCSLLTEFEWFYNDKGSFQWSLKVCSGWWSRQVEGSECFQRNALSTTVFVNHSSSRISQNTTNSNQRLTGRAFTRYVTPKRGWDLEATWPFPDSVWEYRVKHIKDVYKISKLVFYYQSEMFLAFLNSFLFAWFLRVS